MKHQIAIDRGRRGTVALASLLFLWVGLFACSTAYGYVDGQGDFQAYALRRTQASAVEPVVRQALSALSEKTEVAVDARGNRLLVRGSAEVQQLVQDLIRSLDRPAKAAATSKPVLKAYPYSAANAEAVAAEIQGKYPADRGVRVAVDLRTGQLLVVAPPELQPEIAAFLAELGETVASPPSFAPAQRRAVSEPPRPAVAMAAPSAIRLNRATPEEVERKLQEFWRGRLAPVAQSDPEGATLVVPFAGQPALEVQINRRTRDVAVRGPAAAVDSCLRLIKALDQGQPSDDRELQVVPIRAATAGYVQKALAAIDHRPGQKTTSRETVAAIKAPRGALRLAARMFQPKSQPADADQTGEIAPDERQPPGPAAAPAEGQDAEMAEEEDGALVGPVEIEQLPGLDAIIVRGSHRDVERVMQIIEDIERLSAEAEPSVEIYYLKNVDSTTMAAVIGPMYGEHFAPHRGGVAITALVKPNALLLIGRAESIKSALELIGRLDLPGDPASQFKVFRLKHATAAVVSGMVTQFFASRSGLAGAATVTPDARSNSLIVQAGPRDLVEVSQLIRRIDTPTSASVNEMRIFPLRNSLAMELAPILQAAVAGEGSASGGAQRTAPTQGQGGQRAQQAPGAPVQVGAPSAPAGEGASAAAQQAKSLMLRLLTIDEQGQRQISSGILDNVRITANPRSNSLIVSAPAENMELLGALIYELDRSIQAPAQIKVFKIDNGDATAMTDMLEELFGQAVTTGGGGQGQGRGAGGGGGGGPQPGMAPSGEEGPPLPLHFSVDSRTNSIIAAGSAADLTVVEAILLTLDESKTRERQSTVYKLRNSPAIDVALAINDFLRTERQFQQTQPGLLSPFEQIEREVVVVPEIVSNSLIVSATPRFFEEIERIVEQLDTRPPMVMIQVLIAQVSLQGTDEFGIEVGLQNSVLFDRSLLGSLLTITQSTQQAVPGGGTITATNTPVVAATLTPGFDFNNSGLTATGAPSGISLPNSGATSSLGTASQVGAQGLSNFGMGRINNELGYGGLVLSASSDAVNVLLRALRERRRLEVLSRPQVMTLDNQPAYIQVGQQVPLLTNTSVGLAGTIAGVQYRPVGLIVAVTPRISPDGMVVMEIDAEKSSVGPAAEGIQVGVSQNGAPIRQPRIDITQAQTTISAMDGQTVVFGGMLSSSNQLIQRRVPGLAEIPLLGRLFRYDYTQNTRSELLIIMTPRVVRGEMDSESVKQLEASRMSWCLADVQKIHGDTGMRGRGDLWMDDETITIYPDEDPAGMKPQSGETVPAPQPNGPTLAPGESAGRGAPPSARRMAALPAENRTRQPAVQPITSRPPQRAPAGELRLRPAARNAPPPGVRNQVVPAEYRAPAPPGYDPRYAPPPSGYVERVNYDAPIDQQRYRR